MNIFKEKTDNKYFLNLSNNQLNETLKSPFTRFFKFMKKDQISK